ncbi:MAG: DUF4339 domain-containing protein [Verrucomicrobiota bacterium]
MMDEWIIQVAGKDYGPVDLEALLEWKREGRVLAQNPARPADDDLWTTAADIPGLFEPPPLPTNALELALPRRSFAQIVSETFHIYRKGFFQFLYLSLLVALPSVCAQLSGSAVDASAANPDLRTSVAAMFTLFMLLLSLVAWPIYIAGVQVITAELAAGRPARIFGLLHAVLKFWPRVALLCIFVYAVFALLIGFAIGILAMIMVGASSPVLILVALALLVVQVWMFGHFFVNVLFWQQFAVLENSDAGTALRQSKDLARSGSSLSWYQRPMWRGALIVSLWCVVLIAFGITSELPLIRTYLHQISVSTDPQALFQALQATAQSQPFSMTAFGLGLLQTLLRPLVGIAFVLLYLDSKNVER